jgi:hypothetical protein
LSEFEEWVDQWSVDAAKAISEGDAKRARNSIANMTSLSKVTPEVTAALAGLKGQIDVHLGCDEDAAIELVSALRSTAIAAGGNALIEPHLGKPPKLRPR